MPVVCVENQLSHKVTRRYYCVACYRALRRVALRYIPNLTEAETGKQAGKQLAVLLGVETGRQPVEGMQYDVEKIPTMKGADSSMKLVERDVSIDIELHFPAEHVLNRVPFEKFYEEARRERAG
jgi:predicted transposase YbfD/YdcC